MRRLATLLLTCSALLTACGIAADGAPRDIPEADQRQLGVSSGSGGATAGSAHIYLLSPTASGVTPTLQPVARNVRETPSSVLTSLIAGANSDERAKQFRTALPTGLALLSTRLIAGTLHIDLDRHILDVTGTDLVEAVAQIVFTVSEIDGVRYVAISVAGSPQQWPTADGSLQSAPLSVYDFPGLVSSAQPEYPAVPSQN
jgi:spore germination protein GerM